MTVASLQIQRMLDAIGAFAEWSRTEGTATPTGSDFLFGNPHEVAPATYVEALQRATTPTGPQHFAYKMNEPEATTVVAASLRERFGIGFRAEDVAMTNGNFSGLSIVLRALVDPGDEVVFVSPPWFFYEALIVAAGATPVRVYASRPTFDLDLEAIAHAIGPRTRAIIVNSPNNPSGRIYPREDLDALGAILTEAGERHGRPVFLLSDEAYNRIVFDDRGYASPVASYARSFYVYTYGKTHLAPGSRLGFVAWRPDLPEADELRGPLLVSQIANGWAFPVAPLQYALADLDRQIVDVKALQRRRDLLVPALRDQGHEVVEPEGTFYVLVRSPVDDDLAYARALAARDVFVLPGRMFEMPGWFRLSLTANDEMVDRALPRFAEAIAEVRR
ncbi:MAG: aminotransferase class I/II-fold pyridoxal phosphate-dependent enzyme [Planctomycetaceae bacterium]